MSHAHTFKSETAPIAVQAAADAFRPKSRIMMSVLLNELKIEKCVEIHQLIDGILSYLANLIILPYKTAMFKVFQHRGQTAVLSQSALFDDILTRHTHPSLSKGIDYRDIRFRISEQ